MRTRRLASLGLAPLLAMAGVVAAQEQEKQEQEKQEQEQEKQQPTAQEEQITVRLEAVEGSTVSGTAVIRFAATEAAEEPAPGTPVETVEIAYDVSGLEAGGSYRAVIHEGECATGTTVLADLGTVQADESGLLQETVTVENQDAVAILSGERERALEAQEQQERQAMARENVRHLQLQLNDQPVACGNFEPGA